MEVVADSLVARVEHFPDMAADRAALEADRLDTAGKQADKAVVVVVVVDNFAVDNSPEALAVLPLDTNRLQPGLDSYHRPLLEPGNRYQLPVPDSRRQLVMDKHLRPLATDKHLRLLARDKHSRLLGTGMRTPLEKRRAIP
jgi:hypothetical protein